MTTNLTREQIAAMRRSIELGLQLQIDMPEIADDYRNGTSAEEIVNRYGIIKRYSSQPGEITMEIAKKSVYYELKGHDGGFGVPAYKGLIPDEKERKRISGEHRPITSNDTEVRREFHAAGGRKTLELKVGIHGRTPEQRRNDHLKIIDAKGEVSWDNQIEIAYTLSQNPEYQFQSGPYKGRVNTRLIAKKLNRTTSSVKSALYRFRKQKREEVAKASSQ
mgnify:FL=1